MTAREIKIAKSILQVLHDLDGGQAREVSLHGEAYVLCQCSRTEFEAVLHLCDVNGWLTGVQAKLGQGKKWSINDQGEAALLEMA